MRLITQEIAVLLFLASGAGSLFFLATEVSGVEARTDAGTYAVQARFDDIANLEVDADVTLAGVKVGRVTAIGADPAAAQAIVTLRLDSAAGFVASDAEARVVTNGILGGKHVALVQGHARTPLREGGQIEHTQSAMVLEDLIGQVVKKLGD